MSIEYDMIFMKDKQVRTVRDSDKRASRNDTIHQPQPSKQTKARVLRGSEAVERQKTIGQRKRKVLKRQHLKSCQASA